MGPRGRAGPWGPYGEMWGSRRDGPCLGFPIGSHGSPLGVVDPPRDSSVPQFPHWESWIPHWKSWMPIGRHGSPTRSHGSPLGVMDPPLGVVDPPLGVMDPPLGAMDPPLEVMDSHWESWIPH